MAKTINSALRAFTAAWGSSVTSRLRAAKIYADAANTKDTDAKSKFWQLDGFKHWTEQQWSLLYWIGSGVLSGKFIDAKNLSVPLAFAYRGLSIELQESILENGLRLARVDGTVYTMPFKFVRHNHISQVFDEEGNERSIEEQVQWIRNRERSNYDVLANGNVRFRHACVLTPTDMFNILSSEHAPLGVEALMAVITRLSRRVDNDEQS